MGTLTAPVFPTEGLLCYTMISHVTVSLLTLAALAAAAPHVELSVSNYYVTVTAKEIPKDASRVIIMVDDSGDSDGGPAKQVGDDWIYGHTIGPRSDFSAFCIYHVNGAFMTTPRVKLADN